MTGSLLQIVSTDLKDAFLTIDPQITFFKIVYLRHTPFAMDLIEETFNLIPNFGEEGFCQLSKNGDMISSMFLKIEMPSVQIPNDLDSDLIQTNTNKIVKYYDGDLTASQHISNFNTKISDFKIFSASAMVYWRQIYELVTNSTSNYNTVNKLINSILTSQNDIFNRYSSNVNKFTSTIYYYEKLRLTYNFNLLNYILTQFTDYVDSVYNNSLNLEYKDVIKQYLMDYLDNQKYYLQYLITSRDLFLKVSDIDSSPYYYFAWVKKLAFALINTLSFEINGQEIDRVTGDILNTWYELSTPLEKVDILNELIGNVDIMTSYDTDLKPNYTLIIPLPFWFCKYKSQALPCVGLKFSDLIVKVRFNELTDCCYFESYETVETTNININDIIKISNVTLLVEYIHLGDTERNKFGNFTVETLIEQHKIIEFNDITSQTSLLPLDFVNPIREIIWTIQKKSHVRDLKLKFEYSTDDYYYAEIKDVKQQSPNLGCIVVTLSFNKKVSDFADYVDGTLEIINSKYYTSTYQIVDSGLNFFIIDSKQYIYSDKFIIKIIKNKTQNKYIDKQTLQIYGNDIISKRDGEYFSLVEGFKSHTYISPNIYTYSFALNPELFQPSGTLNFSVIDSKNLLFDLDLTTYKKLDTNKDSFIIKIIARSHNMLKLENGQGKTQFGL
jgi:hypothetical protein